MKTGKYENFIPQNIAPYEATKIGVYNANGKKVGGFGLQNLRQQRLGEKLYSFGALADIHIPYETSKEDFQKALIYMNENEKVDFICICGDLTSQGIESHLSLYKEYVDIYSPNTSVYAISGNHETYALDWSQNSEAVTKNLMEKYTRNPIYYSFEQGNDIFIMVGNVYDGRIFGTGELQWLYETLEVNRNKRCFVFQHVRPNDACGNAYGIYLTDIWSGYSKVDASVFESLMKHYKNVIFFHGHSHLKFHLQTKNNAANYDNNYGMHSIHIPSLVAPRTEGLDGTGITELYAESEGYIIDVYKNHIVLRGRDFVKERFLPIATYCIETKLQTIEAGTYKDNTGTLNTDIINE